MKESLKGKVAIVTGGSSGIGRAIVKKFVQCGAHVVIFGRNAERGSEAAGAICEETGCPESVDFIQVDVCSTPDVQKAIRQVLDTCGRVDVLVNNAGVTLDSLLMRMSEEQWDTVLTTNLKSAYSTCNALVRPMMKARSGKIVNISSVVGLTGNAGQAHYAASKSGLIGFTKALAKELASRGICVNCVAPGFVKTKMTDVLTDQQKQAILGAIPLSRMALPEEVAEAVWFLSTDRANYITGQVLNVCGGMVM